MSEVRDLVREIKQSVVEGDKLRMLLPILADELEHENARIVGVARRLLDVNQIELAMLCLGIVPNIFSIRRPRDMIAEVYDLMKELRIGNFESSIWGGVCRYNIDLRDHSGQSLISQFFPSLAAIEVTS